MRCPLAGYAWQVLHYLAGLRALGFDAYFYEDTAYYGDCFDPVSGEMGAARPDAIAFAADFFAAPRVRRALDLLGCAARPLRRPRRAGDPRGPRRGEAAC